MSPRVGQIPNSQECSSVGTAVDTPLKGAPSTGLAELATIQGKARRPPTDHSCEFGIIPLKTSTIKWASLFCLPGPKRIGCAAEGGGRGSVDVNEYGSADEERKAPIEFVHDTTVAWVGDKRRDVIENGGRVAG